MHYYDEPEKITTHVFYNIYRIISKHLNRDSPSDS